MERLVKRSIFLKIFSAPGRVRTYVGRCPGDLQSPAIDHSATDALARFYRVFSYFSITIMATCFPRRRRIISPGELSFERSASGFSTFTPPTDTPFPSIRRRASLCEDERPVSTRSVVINTPSRRVRVCTALCGTSERSVLRSPLPSVVSDSPLNSIPEIRATVSAVLFP